MAHALIYSELLERAIRSIQTPCIKKQTNTYQSHPDCLFCRQVKASEDIYVKAFMDAINDDDFKTRYIKSGLLCVPRLELMKIKKDHKNTGKIKEATLQKYKVLMNQLSEIKRKNDYRYSDEPWSEHEKTAWKKAVSTINAYKGIRK